MSAYLLERIEREDRERNAELTVAFLFLLLLAGSWQEPARG